MQEEKRKIVAFYRLSKVDGDILQGYSHRKRKEIRQEIFESHINTQRMVVEEALEKINGDIIVEFSDIIGRNRVNGSLEFKMALDCALNNGADLMVSTFDRIGDELHFVLDVQKKLGQKGLKLWFADFLDADELVLVIKIKIAEKERQLASKRQKDKARWVKKYGSKSGKPHGNPHFKNGKFKPEYDRYRAMGPIAQHEASMRDEHNRMIASYIIEARRNHKSVKEVADILNSNGWRSSDGNQFTPRMIYHYYNKFIKVYDKGFVTTRAAG